MAYSHFIYETQAEFIFQKDFLHKLSASIESNNLCKN